MIKGLYTSAMGMLIQEAEQNVTTNNLANVNTTGYKKDRITFEEFPTMLELRLNDTKLAPGQKFYMPPEIGKLGTGVILDQITTNHEAGSLRETFNSTDLALDNKAYFAVQTPDGIRYTKDGQFRVTQDGFLVTRQGYRVLGTQERPQHLQSMIDSEGNLANNLAPVVIEDDISFTIDEDGRVFNNNVDSGQAVLKVAFRNTNHLDKEGGNYYKLTDGAALYDGNSVMKQGFLENSNVNVVQEMVNMIRLSRAYEANSKILTGIDERIGQAAREVGAVRG